MKPSSDQLRAVLRDAQQRGFLGPADIDEQLTHALGFARALASTGAGPPSRWLDLGSGGGLPGLVLAVRRWAPEGAGSDPGDGGEGVLLEANRRRADFLKASLTRLGLGGMTVLEGRAEEVAHDPRFRGAMQVVVARSFGRPAVTAECSAGFLRPGGFLVVSDPPVSGPERWPGPALQELGLTVAPRSSQTGAHQFQVLRLTTACPERYPRRVGVPAKRPLF